MEKNIHAFDRNNQKQHIPWIDFAKGIAILSVIVGHTVSFGSMLRNAIFVFHMPLFFILAGWLFRASKNTGMIKKNIIKSFRRLIIPGIVVTVLMCFINILRHTLSDSINIISDTALAFFWSSGTEYSCFGLYIPAIGMPWFFITLFSARILFDFILKISPGRVTAGILSAVLSVLGILLGYKIVLPLNFTVTLSVLFFMYFGYAVGQLKFIFANFDCDSKEKINSQKKCHNKNAGKLYIRTIFMIFCIILWIICAKRGIYVELAARSFPVFPLSYTIAILATITVCVISAILVNMPVAGRLISFIGKHSLLLMCIHMFDGILFNWNDISIFHSGIPDSLSHIILRLLWNVLWMYLILALKKRINITEKGVKEH